MKLYYSPGACSLAAHIVIEEAGLDVEPVKVNLKTHLTETGEDFTSINPKGYVPTLGLNGGGILTENVAILVYLGDRKPEAKLVPSSSSLDHYRLLEWLAFITSEVHKSFSPLFHGASDEEKNQAMEKILKRFAFIEQHLGGKQFLLGAQFSVADAYLFVMLRWASASKIDISTLANLVAYKTRVGERPKVQAALKSEGLI